MKSLESYRATGALVAINIATFFNATCIGALMVAVPLFAQSLGASTFEIGVIVGTVGLLGAFSSVPLGNLSDHLGRKKLLIQGLVLYVIIPLLYLSVKLPLLFLPLRALQGFIDPVVFNIPIVIASELGLMPGRAIGTTSSSLYLGLFVGPIVNGFLSIYSPSYTFLFCSLISFFSLLLVSFFVPETLHTDSRSPTYPGLIVLKTLIKDKILVSLCSVNFARGMVWGLVFSQLIIFLRAVGMSEMSIGGMVSTFLGLFTLIQVLTGKLAETIKEKQLLSISSCILTVTFIAVPFTPEAFFWIISGTLGSFSGVMHVSALTLLIKRSPFKRGLTTTAYAAFWYIGYLISPILSGYIAMFNPSATYFFFAVMYIIIYFICKNLESS